MARTILVTGAASGIGRAAVERCRAAGDRVIGADLRGAEIEADLGTADGRARLVDEAARLAPDGLDGVLAGAGISNWEKPRETIAINYFGAVATLEGLRPLLARSRRPRAVAICSTALMLPSDADAIGRCLAGDEDGALARIAEVPDTAYPSSKRALALWLRQAAASPAWGGSGILLNGIGPGVIETAMTAPLFDQPDMMALIRQSNPIAVEGYAKAAEVAELIDFLLGFETHYLLGQVIFIDGGSDAMLRPELV
jgi:NAD(P)-dependent dehydrogenase (short-subunit alcohol dehydrogenase family)